LEFGEGFVGAGGDDELGEEGDFRGAMPVVEVRRESAPRRRNSWVSFG
jgi:hypothetical protein